MKRKFNLQQALSAKRNEVIAKYQKLTEERFFDGCSLRTFMMEVMTACERNGIGSEQRLATMLPMLMGNIYINHSKVEGRDMVTEKMRNEYRGTAYMALV